MGLGFRVQGDVTPIGENQMDKNMEHEMDAGIIQRPKGPRSYMVYT